MKSSLMCALVFAGLIVRVQGQGNTTQDTIRGIPKKLSQYFSPPPEFRNSYGSYRSPLKFYNGSLVKSPKEWRARRKEILDQWNRMMGEWPPLLTGQQMVFTDSTKMDGFTNYRVRFKWTPTEETEGYLLVPDGNEKKPAVITVYYEPETAIGLNDSLHPSRDFALQLTKRGFVTLSLGTSGGTKDKTYALYYPDITNTRVEPLSMLACAAANAWYVLSKIPIVDSSRIGIMGHSYGGKWAMFASCLFDKFACSVWSDPGIVFDESDEAINYYEPWYLGYHPKPWRTRGRITEQNPAKGLYPKLVAGGYDLHELHSLMAPRPFLVSGGSADGVKRWVALNHSIQVNKLLGFNNRVAMTNRPAHSPTPASNDVAYTFFEYFLKVKPVHEKRPF